MNCEEVIEKLIALHESGISVEKVMFYLPFGVREKLSMLIQKGDPEELERFVKRHDFEEEVIHTITYIEAVLADELAIR